MPYGRRVPRGTRSLRPQGAGRRAPRYRSGPLGRPSAAAQRSAAVRQWDAQMAEHQRQFNRGRRAPRYR